MNSIEVIALVWILVVLGFIAWAVWDLHTFDRKRQQPRPAETDEDETP